MSMFLGTQTFDHVEGILAQYIKRKDMPMRKAISVRKRLAVGLWRMANSGEAYRTIATQFGIGLSSACEITNEVCQVIQDIICYEKIDLFVVHDWAIHDLSW